MNRRNRSLATRTAFAAVLAAVGAFLPMPPARALDPSITINGVVNGVVPVGVIGIQMSVACTGLSGASPTANATYLFALAAAPVPTYWPLTPPVGGGAGSSCTFSAKLAGSANLSSGVLSIAVGGTTQAVTVGGSPTTYTTASIAAWASTTVVVTASFAGLTVRNLVVGTDPTAATPFDLSIFCTQANGITPVPPALPFTGQFSLQTGQLRIFGLNEFPTLLDSSRCRVVVPYPFRATFVSFSTSGPVLDTGGGPASPAAVANGQTITVRNSFTDMQAVTPVRLADTRPGGSTIDGLVAGVGKLVPGGTLTIPASPRAGVPLASTIVLNVTITDPAGDGYTTVYPCGEPQPNASNLNFTAGTTIANAVVSKIGAGGAVCVFSSAATHVIVDTAGFYLAGTGITPMSPARLADTRPGGATIDGIAAGGGPLIGPTVFELPVLGRAGITAARAAVLNITVTGPQGAGWVTVFPCGEAQPNASNVNYVAGQTIPNAVIAKIGGNGKVCLFTAAAANLIVDVSAVLGAASKYSPVGPARLLDSRPGQTTVDGQNAGFGLVTAGGTVPILVGGRGGVSNTASTGFLNVTVTQPAGDGYLTVFPCGEPRPNSSSLNFSAGQTIANAVIAKLSTGTPYVCVFTSATTHLIVDINGFE